MGLKGKHMITKKDLLTNSKKWSEAPCHSHILYAPMEQGSAKRKKPKDGIRMLWYELSGFDWFLATLSM
ncbi:hypothetical protein AMTR_s00089p00102850 [Amborella trichopoda]|uniref:Uncharacterized protein n=1 Tax=Amborella trichopoda TaxID=13333 RepID=W1P4H7_AMBTC|nr:hypothetical protein AMTR_s00089p00102850 [Amborella trichopoda]